MTAPFVQRPADGEDQLSSDAGRHGEPHRASPVLSVAIPTYNRAETLRRQLQSLLGQIVGCQEDIEIVVSDNASSDSTRSVVDEMRQHFPVLKYVRNAQNLGLLQNVDRAARACEGDYVWFVGDDDVLMPFALETVVNTIRSAWTQDDPAAFILLNAYPVAADDAWVGASQIPPWLRPGLIPSAGQIFLSFDYASIGCITQLVVRRLDWTARPFVIEGPWAAYAHLRHLLTISRGHPAFFVGAPLVGIRHRHSPQYHNHLALAYCIEFHSYDSTLLNEWHIPRPEVSRAQRRRARATLRAFVKVNLFREYAPYWARVDAVRLLTPEGRVARWAARLLFRNRPWSPWIRRRFEPRLPTPIATDQGLHDVV